MPYIATADIAAVAAAILDAPASHVGETYVLTGSISVSDAQLADVLTELTDRPITYHDQTLDDLAAGLASQGSSAWYVEHLVGFEAWKASGDAAQTTDTVEQILGRPALTPRQALERYQEGL